MIPQRYYDLRDDLVFQFGIASRWPAHGRFISYVAHAGLANRLRAMYAAMCIGLASNRNVLHHWRSNNACGAKASDIFPIGASAYKRFGVPTIVHPPFFRSALSLPYIKHIDRTHAPLLLSGRWQYLPFEVLLHQDRPAPLAAKMFRELVLGTTPAAPGESQRIAVHIRRGDFGTKRPIQAYIDAAEHLASKLHASDPRIELMSDDALNCLPAFQSAFGQSRVICREPDQAHTQRNSQLGASLALASLRRLANAQALVRTRRSSFGSMAMALGRIPRALTLVV
jgi:hypothetical protein